MTYLQITPKSRSDIREYEDMERQISEAAGRINGAYGEAAWTPIRYIIPFATRFMPSRSGVTSAALAER